MTNVCQGNNMIEIVLMMLTCCIVGVVYGIAVMVGSIVAKYGRFD
jgi:hypothetical protein